MSLTGNLEVFPLEEVLRLLARSRKTGCLRVDGTGHQGRVFLQNGSLTLAMTASDEDFQRQILASGLVADSDLRQVEAGAATLSDVAGAAITEFVREYTVESLYRIRKPGSGAFDFVIDLQPRYPTGQIFDVEVGIAEADRRANEWAEIESVIPDLDTPYRMVSEIPEGEEITLAAPAWKILAGLAGGTTVRQLAAYLGSTEFRAARDLADLARRHLVMAVTEPVAAEAVATEPAPVAEPAHDESWFAVKDPTPTPAAPDADDSSATEGWWETQTPETASEESPVPPEATLPDSDSDRFLESVFSQLETDDDASEGGEDETEGGFNMGLLRRRRMGAVIRDSEDG